MFVTFLLFMPLFIKIPYLVGFLDFIPTVLIVKMSATPNLPYEMLIYLIPTILVSTLFFILAVRYFRHERAIRL
jgi:ABC-2 type transport system permease protein